VGSGQEGRKGGEGRFERMERVLGCGNWGLGLGIQSLGFGGD
jgi:hypothetical protein